jgi:hypothetical protein
MQTGDRIERDVERLAGQSEKDQPPPAQRYPLDFPASRS